MQHPRTYTSSSIGPAPNLGLNFLPRSETVSITWDDGFNFQDDAWFRVFHQCEPPEVLDVIDRLIASQQFYDLILAWDSRVLRECPNAVFLTESACSWLDRKSGTISPAPLGQMRVEGYDKPQANPVVLAYPGCDVSAKRFAVSFLTSNKAAFPGHILRQEIYNKLPESISALQVWKHRSPPRVEDKRTILEPYQFSIVPENSKHDGYYSEKVIDCFVAKTIPLYWGCPDLEQRFNPNGIIRFDSYEDLCAKLAQLTPDTYASKRAAIEDNFHLALKGVHQWDLIENAITEGIAKKHENGGQHIAAVPTVLPIRRLRRQ